MKFLENGPRPQPPTSRLQSAHGSIDRNSQQSARDSIDTGRDDFVQSNESHADFGNFCSWWKFSNFASTAKFSYSRLGRELTVENFYGNATFVLEIYICIYMYSVNRVARRLLRISASDFFLFFFLSWVANTLLNHWTEWVVHTHLIRILKSRFYCQFCMADWVASWLMRISMGLRPLSPRRRFSDVHASMDNNT